MLRFLSLVVLIGVSFAQDTTHTPPKVQLYSYQPGELDKENFLICHVSGFHPPDISIQLLKNGMEIPHADLTDLAFKRDWRFHLTKNVAFTPTRDDKFSCRVTHGDNVKDYAWESNM